MRRHLRVVKFDIRFPDLIWIQTNIANPAVVLWIPGQVVIPPVLKVKQHTIYGLAPGNCISIVGPLDIMKNKNNLLKNYIINYHRIRRVF